MLLLLIIIVLVLVLLALIVKRVPTATTRPDSPRRRHDRGDLPIIIPAGDAGATDAEAAADADRFTAGGGDFGGGGSSGDWGDAGGGDGGD